MAHDTGVIPARPLSIDDLFPEVVFAGADTAFAGHSDRLVRHLFDVGLRLHCIAHRVDATGYPVLRDDTGEMAEVLNDLDLIIRDAGVAMLALTCASLEDGGAGARSSKRHFPPALT